MDDLMVRMAEHIRKEDCTCFDFYTWLEDGSFGPKHDTCDRCALLAEFDALKAQPSQPNGVAVLIPVEIATSAADMLRSFQSTFGTHRPDREGEDERTAWDEIDRLCDGLSASPSTADVAGWMPIETAPKDRSILLFGRVDAGDRGCAPTIALARWCEDEGYFGEEGGWMVLFTDGHIASVESPTHWKPLPAAPDPVSHTTGREKGNG